MKVVPSSFECHDEANELVFTIKAFDECCVTVSIESCVNDQSWAEISNMITKCIHDVELES